MHPEARAFVKRIAASIKPKTALEIGARDVNGNCRDLFPSVTLWYGIDLREGPNVDSVADAEIVKVDPEWELVLCTEVLEHAANPDLIMGTAHDALIEGGFLVLTCAGPGRKPHDNDGNHPAEMTEHYSNISEAQMQEWLLDHGFTYQVEENQVAKDIYVFAVK